MGTIDGLKEQVEELKQRLNAPDAQPGAAAGELKARLASIKASLESKQQEIARLAGEKERLAADAQRMASENEQLRKMLGEVLAAIDGQAAESSTRILREFLAETDPLVKPAGNGVRDVPAAGQPARQPAGQPASSGPAARDAARTPDPEVAIPLGSDVRDEGPEGADEEESPALRRILKRGRRAG